LVRPGIDALQLVPKLSAALLQGDSHPVSERLADMRHVTGDLTVAHANQTPRPFHD